LLLEREVARLLGATCDSAVGVFSQGDTLHAWIGAADGSEWIADSYSGSVRQFISRLQSVGAQDLIA